MSGIVQLMIEFRVWHSANVKNELVGQVFVKIQMQSVQWLIQTSLLLCKFYFEYLFQRECVKFTQNDRIDWTHFCNTQTNCCYQKQVYMQIDKIATDIRIAMNLLWIEQLIVSQEKKELNRLSKIVQIVRYNLFNRGLKIRTGNKVSFTASKLRLHVKKWSFVCLQINVSSAFNALFSFCIQTSPSIRSSGCSNFVLFLFLLKNVQRK